MEQLTPDIQKKFDEANTLLDKVHVLLEDMRNPEVLYNKLQEDESTYNNIALVQCFYGTDISRIRATTQALEFNFQLTCKPSTWVFVECQRKRSDCAFQWLKKYGIKHVFVQSTADSDNIMIKNPLWTIGAGSCTEPNLCFIDSDVVMCNSDWVKKASEAFMENDVLSLASHQYYQMDDKCKLHETIGYKWANNGMVGGGHVGFTFGITRQALEEIGGIEPAIILDDMHVYHKIIGEDGFKPFEKWYNPFKLKRGLECGHNLRLGYADNIACHVWHGEYEEKYSKLVELLCHSDISSLEDLMNLDTPLPTWKATTKCQALRKVISKYNEYLSTYMDGSEKPEFDIVGEFRSEMKGICGVPDENHPLFVCTVVKDGFGVKLDDFIHFRYMVEDKFKFNTNVQPIVLFATDCKKFDFKGNEINTVPLKNYNPDDKFAQCLRKDLKFPKNAVIYYIPFDVKDFNENIWIPDGKFENPDGTILFSR